MPASQQIPQDASSPANGHSTVHDLFALTDEQILEIEPEVPESVTANNAHQAGVGATLGSPAVDGDEVPATGASPVPARQSADGVPYQSPTTSHDSAEPPPWLAAQMKDPWSGEEARELWNGVQQARQEAAAYRAAFATPEDARTLKELYPGGVSEARAAAERARTLDDIDRAFFGSAGKSPQEVSASREQLAQQMLHEDPAAFREMVFAGLRALEQTSNPASATTVGATLGSPGANGGEAVAGGASPSPTAPSGVGAQRAAPLLGNTSTSDSHLAAYASFEKAANEDLERSVAATIDRTLNQALPNVARSGQDASTRAGQAPPLQARLSAAIRQDVEAALKGDRQLGEQVAQILSGKRLDNETRVQVVRLINDRAQQLVPVAAKRVLNDWTQTTLAAHRGNSARTEAASARREVVPASPESRSTSLSSSSPGGSNRAHSQDPNRSPARPDARRVDYRKLSDEQILDL